MPEIRPVLPSWWSREHYYFLEDMPIEGWIWEFLRRVRLKEVLRVYPVDAMNPEPDLDRIEPDYWNYYKSWIHPHWENKFPFFIPPAVTISGHWPEGFEGQQYRIDDELARNLVSFKVDINRRDTRIIHDFQEALAMLRQDRPEKKRSSARTQDWYRSRILEIWDLRQYKVSWSTIVENFSSDSINFVKTIQQARNSFNSARNYIELDGWKTLMRNYIF